MPIVRVESSVPLATPRADALAAIGECIVRNLDVKPVQIRATITDLDPASVMVSGKTGADAPPYIVAWASILEGRSEEKRVAFVSDMLTVVATIYGVDESVVRVLVSDFRACTGVSVARRRPQRGKFVLQDAIRTMPRTGVLDVKLFIDGKYVDAISGKTFDDVNPATGEVIAKVAEADYADVDLAVKAARKAFDEGPWPKMPVAERSAILMKLAAGIRKRVDEMSEIESLDTGKPISETSHLDIPRGAYNFEFFAELIKYESTACNPVDDKFLNYELREPVGVVGCISPWNLPLLLLTWKLGPALACGNTVVCKPAEFTPITASMLGEIANEAGLPPGVLNIVHGFGPNAAGSAITEHPDVNCISFTGETTTGKAIMKAAADGLKEVSFELGGKAAAVIFADADLDVVIAQTTRSTFLNQGQVCLASPRLLVQRPIYDEFCKRYQASAEKLVFGDPLDHKTTIGSLVDKEHFDRVVSYIEIAKAEGARLLFGGTKPDMPPPFDKGAFLKPTAFVDVNNSMRICQEEVFGPVVTIMPFDTEEEGIAIANDVKYGLAATIFTQDLKRAHRVARKIRAGIVWVNCWFVRDLRTPFGGMGESGIGREGGRLSLEFYSELKNICIAL